jgi:hypothetical protein
MCCITTDGVLRYYANGPVEEGNFEGVDVKVRLSGVPASDEMRTHCSIRALSKLYQLGAVSHTIAKCNTHAAFWSSKRGFQITRCTYAPEAGIGNNLHGVHDRCVTCLCCSIIVPRGYVY